MLLPHQTEVYTKSIISVKEDTQTCLSAYVMPPESRLSKTGLPSIRFISRKNCLRRKIVLDTRR